KNSYNTMADQSEDLNKHVKDLQDQEVAAVKDNAGTEAELKRLARIAHDRGKLVRIYARLAGLPVFGPGNQMYLTHLYVSRQPLGGKSLLDSSSELMSLEHSADLNGKESFYAPLAKGGDPSGTPPESRPDVPLIVILSGEVATNG